MERDTATETDFTDDNRAVNRSIKWTAIIILANTCKCYKSGSSC